MMRMLVGLALAATWCVVAADEPQTKPLTPQERKESLAKWREFNRAGLQHYQAGKLADATDAWTKALEIARRLYAPQDHADLAQSVNNLAVVLWRRHKYAAAEPLGREALDMNRRLYPKQDHVSVAASLNLLALILKDGGNYADAEPFAREALDMKRRMYGKMPNPDLAQSLNTLAAVLAARGKYAEAERLFREAVDVTREVLPKQDHLNVAQSVSNLAEVLREQGKNTDAEQLHRDALAMLRRLYPKQDQPLVARSLNTLAMVLEAQGRYPDAEPLHREALAMARRLFPDQDHPLVAAGLIHLGKVLQDQGNYADAEPLLSDALAMNRRLYAPRDHPRVAQSLNDLATTLRYRAKYDKAESLYVEALEMRRRLYPKQDHPDLAQSLNNLAILFRLRGQNADAEKRYREVLPMVRRLYPGDHPYVAGGLNNLANVLHARREDAESEELYREALAMHRRLYPNRDHPMVALSLNNLATVLKSRHKHDEAGELYRASLAMYRALAEDYAALRSEGDALTLASTYPEARDGFLDNARAQKADPVAVYREVWASKAALTRVYERRALAARAAAADAKAGALLEQLSERRRRRADLLLAPIPADEPTREQRDADLARYTREIAALDRDLRPLLPAVERADKLANAAPADLQKILPADAALVDFLRCTVREPDSTKPGVEGYRQTTRYLAFVVTKDKVSWLDLEEAKPIEEAVAAWRGAITGGKDLPPQLPAKVRELVWAKVRKELPDTLKVVYISPDSALCRVPWAALPGDRANSILLEDYAVATIPHAVFLLDKLGPQDARKNRPTDVLAAGGVAYDARPPSPEKAAVNRGDPLLKPGQEFGWSPLPGAAAEVKGVSGAAKKKDLVCHPLEKEEATRAAVLAALPKARYAHLATHGFFADASFRSAFHVDPKLFERTARGERVGAGLRSPLVMTGLVFAGANKPDTPGRGVVTGEALVDLDLSGLDLAVLSACETGLGDVADGEGSFGLQRAFHLAGTRDVIASLWKVPDRPTAALMALFYRNLWEKNVTPVEALRQAQLEIYRNPDKITAWAADFRGTFEEVPSSGDEPPKPAPDGKAHPRLWAAFTLSGPGR